MSSITKSVIFVISILGGISGLSGISLAAIPAAKQNINEQWLKTDGAIRGGVADTYMSLFDVRKSASKKLKTERLILDWGDGLGRASAKGGYYQVEYQAKAKRVIINLALTLNSKIEGQVLTDRLAKGLYIKQAKLEFDPMNQSQSLVLDLKSPVRVRVASYPSHLQQPKAPARLVVDLVE